MALVGFGAVKSTFETLDLSGRYFELPSETGPVCMICDVIPLPAFLNKKFWRKDNPH